jgi:hypothetical protein
MTPDRTLLRIGTWAGLTYLLVFGLGWLLLARFLPPISPSDSAAQVADRYADLHWQLMVAGVAIMVSTVLLLPLGALAVLLVQRIERSFGMLTLMMAFVMTTFMVLNFYTGLAFNAAAFRVDRPAELVQALNDLGFMQFMGGTPLFLAIWGVLAWAILITQPKSGVEVFPRWVGYVNLLVVICYLPEILIYLLKSGPFAWDGIVGFWIPAVLLIGYMLASPFILRDAVRRAFG